MPISPIFLVGPTGVGKSQIAVLLAHRINAEIVSCDSMQVYRNMDIATDKPSMELRNKIRHHLIDIVDISEEYDAARYIDDAGNAIRDIKRRGRIPLIVGGTGLYIRALTDGLFAGPGSNRKIRTNLEKKIKGEGLDSVYEELKRADPAGAVKIHKQDKRRIIRALEVYYITGRPISSFQNQWQKKKDRIIIGLNRARKDLYQRIDRRVDEMFDKGIVEEAERLLNQGVMQNKTAGQSLGYKEIAGYLNGTCSLEETKDLLKRNTRRFAKRQLTWFLKDDRVKWFFIHEHESLYDILKRIIDFLEEYSWLGTKKKPRYYGRD